MKYAFDALHAQGADIRVKDRRLVAEIQFPVLDAGASHPYGDAAIVQLGFEESPALDLQAAPRGGVLRLTSFRLAG